MFNPKQLMYITNYIEPLNNKKVEFVGFLGGFNEVRLLEEADPFTVGHMLLLRDKELMVDVNKTYEDCM